MASSYSFFKDEVAQYLKDKFPKSATILDVGPGCGTYFNYLRDYFKAMDAVEVYQPIIDKFELKKKYRKVYNKNITDFKYAYYDIIIFGDVLEHLTVEDAQKVLKYACKRCKEVIVAVPYLYPQGAEGDNAFAEHKQDDLTKENMLERYPQLKLLYSNDLYGYYVKK